MYFFMLETPQGFGSIGFLNFLPYNRVPRALGKRLPIGELFRQSYPQCELSDLPIDQGMRASL